MTQIKIPVLITNKKAAVTRENKLARKVISIGILALFLVFSYQLIGVDVNFFSYAMQIRAPKLIAIIFAAFCIGTATIVFQSTINNRIVTPCLLGMNSLYILIHTSIAFIFGTAHDFSADRNIAFVIDLFLMSVVSTFLYSYLFKKTNYNILFVLLCGTVMATLFQSISDTMLRILDPNEYDVLLASLVAGFDEVNADILMLCMLLIVAVAYFFRKEILLLDVITLGKEQAINLGVDYDKTVRRLLIAVTFYITIATALVGPISFLGLIIANLAREFLTSYRTIYLMLASFLLGVIVLLFGQLLIEHVFEFSTVISVFINVLGGVYFLYLVLRSKGI